MTSDSGTGKTTALRRLRDELQNSTYRVLYLSDSKMTPRTFYKSILEQLGFEAKYLRSEAKRQLHKEIEIMKGVHGLLPVAIVDELCGATHNFSYAGYIFMLSNVHNMYSINSFRHRYSA
jgi:type II secretory pathway predicted ATPase ExeA